VLTLGTALLAAIFLREGVHANQESGDVTWQTSRQRVISAQASLRGIVINARAVRSKENLQR